MDLVKWGMNPWGQSILTHVSWTLFWASLFAGLMFLQGLAICGRSILVINGQGHLAPPRRIAGLGE